MNNNDVEHNTVMCRLILSLPSLPSLPLSCYKLHQVYMRIGSLLNILLDRLDNHEPKNIDLQSVSYPLGHIYFQFSYDATHNAV